MNKVIYQGVMTTFRVMWYKGQQVLVKNFHYLNLKKLNLFLEILNRFIFVTLYEKSSCFLIGPQKILKSSTSICRLLSNNLHICLAMTKLLNVLMIDNLF